jgi:hypothetical protein
MIVDYITIEQTSAYYENQADLKELIEITQLLAQEQKTLITFLIHQSEHIPNKDIAELLLVIGNILFASVKTLRSDLPMITQDQISKAESDFYNQMHLISAMSEMDAITGFDEVFRHQPYLSNYVIEWVDQLSEDGVQDATLQTFYAALQTIVNALDHALQTTPNNDPLTILPT